MGDNAYGIVMGIIQGLMGVVAFFLVHTLRRMQGEIDKLGIGLGIADRIFERLPRIESDVEALQNKLDHFAPRSDMTTQLEHCKQRLEKDLERVETEINRLKTVDEQIAAQLSQMAHKDDLKDMRADMNRLFDKLFTKIESMQAQRNGGAE